MSTYVLVHGAWHGSWCWAYVMTRLQHAGHNVVVLDLPGRAGDQTPHRAITLDHFADKVCGVIERQAEPVILVGHSMGGISITAATERCPDKVRTLVYLAAYMLRDGESLVEIAVTDAGSLAAINVDFDEPAGTFRLRPDAPVGEIFYASCTEDDVRRAAAMLVPETLGPAATPIRRTAERYERVPRVYIECLRDRAVSIDMQRAMCAATPCARVFSLDTDHSPFFSAVEPLTEYLLSLAR